MTAPATRSTCPYCGVGCGVIATPQVDGSVAITGDPDHPANFGRLCSKGLALAETLGSIGAHTRLPDPTKQACVGLEINANPLTGVRDGHVIGRATALHVGRRTQVWEIRITHEETGALVCISRITMAVIDI